MRKLVDRLLCFVGWHDYVTCLDGKTKKCIDCYKIKGGANK